MDAVMRSQVLSLDHWQSWTFSNMQPCHVCLCPCHVCKIHIQNDTNSSFYYNKRSKMLHSIVFTVIYNEWLMSTEHTHFKFPVIFVLCSITNVICRKECNQFKWTLHNLQRYSREKTISFCYCLLNILTTFDYPIFLSIVLPVDYSVCIGSI